MQFTIFRDFDEFCQKYEYQTLNKSNVANGNFVLNS